MRCPKCGYTSFDDQERCKKCKKTMSPASLGVTGTVFDCVAPAYLMWGDIGRLGAGGVGKGSGLSTSLNKVEPGIVDSRSSEHGKATDQAETAALNQELGKVDISDLSSPPSPTSANDKDFSLEDLQVDDLQVGITKSSQPVASNQRQPAAKTGTALDSFDVELDALLEEEENEKA